MARDSTPTNANTCCSPTILVWRLVPRRDALVEVACAATGVQRARWRLRDPTQRRQILWQPDVIAEDMCWAALSETTDAPVHMVCSQGSGALLTPLVAEVVLQLPWFLLSAAGSAVVGPEAPHRRPTIAAAQEPLPCETQPEAEEVPHVGVPLQQSQGQQLAGAQDCHHGQVRAAGGAVLTVLFCRLRPTALRSSRAT